MLTELTTSIAVAPALLESELSQRAYDDPFAEDHEEFTEPLRESATARVEPVATAVLASIAHERLRPIRAPASFGMAPRALTVGAMLRGRYVLREIIGRGGDAIVFRADDLHRASSRDAQGGPVVIKALKPEQQFNPNALTRMKREFRKMQSLTHSGIARVFDLDCDGDFWFISMEFVPGCTLATWLESDHDVDERLRLIGECCEALAHAHAHSVVHGDVKPSNVLVSADGHIKLIDFGSVPSVDSTKEAACDASAAATISHASPEVLAGGLARDLDDIFSLACLSYVILSRGVRPFGDASPLEARQAGSKPAHLKGLNEQVNAAIERGLAVERDARPRSVIEFWQELTAAVSPSAVSPESCAASHDQAGELLALGQPIQALPAIEGGIAPVPCEPGAPAFVPIEESLASAIALPVVCGPGWLQQPLTWAAAAIVMLAMTVTLMRAGALELEKSRPSTPRTVDATVALALPKTVAAAVPAAAPVAAGQARALPAKVALRTAGMVGFQSRSISVGEAQALVAVPIQRVSSTHGRATVAWSIERGSAQPGIDYPAVARGVARFVEGQAVRTIFIPLLPKSRAARHSRSFTVALQPVAGGPAVGPLSRTTVTISPGAGVETASR